MVETSSAKIEQNVITNNILANIALGGVNSGDTYIIKNTISGSKSEGIYVIQGENCLITRNQIFQNFDGVVSSNSQPTIQHNDILENKRCGVLILDGSFANLLDNNIKNND